MGDVAARRLPGHERIIELDAEPCAEFRVIGERPPHAGNGRLQFNGFFDAI
jgi:hypothetical protein